MHTQSINENFASGLLMLLTRAIIDRSCVFNNCTINTRSKKTTNIRGESPILKFLVTVVQETPKTL